MPCTLPSWGVLISLTGCAIAPSDLRNPDHYHHAQFVVQQGYQSAHRGILERQRACEQVNVITAKSVVSGDLYTDIQSGTISRAQVSALRIQASTVIDMKAAGEESAEVFISSRTNSARYEPLIRKWLAGVREC